MRRAQYDRVIFRQWPKREGGDVIAILPDVPANRGRVMTYQHVGQHGEGDYQVILERTRPAKLHKVPEVAELVRELEQIGYKPVIARRMQRRRS